jgi:hypothetical protein
VSVILRRFDLAATAAAFAFVFHDQMIALSLIPCQDLSAIFFQFLFWPCPVRLG